MTDIIEEKDKKQLEKIEDNIRQQKVASTPNFDTHESVKLKTANEISNSKNKEENNIAKPSEIKLINNAKPQEIKPESKADKDEKSKDKKPKEPYNNIEYILSKLSNNDNLVSSDDFVYFITAVINNANLTNQGKEFSKKDKGALLEQFYKQINKGYKHTERYGNDPIGVDYGILYGLKQLQPIEVNGKKILASELYKDFCSKNAIKSRLACAGDSVALLQATQLNELKFNYRDNPQKLDSINELVFKLIEDNIYNHINQDAITMLDKWKKETDESYSENGDTTIRKKAYQEVLKETLFCLVISNPVFLTLYIIKLILNKNTKDVGKGKGDQNLDNFTKFLNIKAIEDFINKAINFVPDKSEDLSKYISESRTKALKKITENNKKVLDDIRTNDLKKKFGDDPLFDKITKIVGTGAEKLLYADNNFREYIINKEKNISENQLKQSGIETENKIKQDITTNVADETKNKQDRLETIQKQLNEIKTQIKNEKDKQKQQQLEHQQEILLKEEEKIKKMLEEERRKEEEERKRKEQEERNKIME